VEDKLLAMNGAGQLRATVLRPSLVWLQIHAKSPTQSAQVLVASSTIKCIGAHHVILLVPRLKPSLRGILTTNHVRAFSE